MQDLLAFIFVILSFVVYFAIIYCTHEQNSDRFKVMIEDEVRREGGRNVHIKEVDILTYYLSKAHYRKYQYRISFDDKNGQTYLAECWVRNSLLRGTEMRWKYTPALLIYAQQHPLEAVDIEAWVPEVHIYAEKPSKELLFDGLNSHFRYERLATIRRISELPQVDEFLIAKIREIAANDPEREVAAVAREFLNS